MKRVRNFRDLMVWQKSMALVTVVYRITSGFPTHEMYGLSAQLRRCAVSIPSNIAEGHGRSTTKEYLRFLRTAVGSLCELRTQVEIGRNLDYLHVEQAASLERNRVELDRMLASLIRNLKRRLTGDP